MKFQKRYFFLVIAIATNYFSWPAFAAPIGPVFSSPTSADPFSAFNNPAAMTLIRGTRASIYGTYIPIRIQFQTAEPSAFDGNPYPQANLFVHKPDGALGVVTDAGLNRFRFGFGAAIPVMDGASWEETYNGKPSSVQYYALEGRQAHFTFGPTASVKINKFISIGLGLDVIGVMFSHKVMTDFGAKINQMACSLQTSNPCTLDTLLKREDPDYAALTSVSGLGWTVGVSGGILITPVSWLRLGASVHSGGNVSVPVETTVDLPQAVVDFVNQNLPSVSLPEMKAEGTLHAASPTIVTASAAFRAMTDLELVTDMRWINKARMSVLQANITKSSTNLISDQVLIKRQENDWLIGLAGIYRLGSDFRFGLRIEFDPNFYPDLYTTPVSMNFDKILLSGGVEWHPIKWFSFSVEYGHYFLFSREIAASNFEPNANPTTKEEEGFDKPSARGLYQAQTDRIGMNMTVLF